MTVTTDTCRLRDAVAEGKRLRAAGQFDAAQCLYRQIVEQLPNHAVGWLGLGEVLLDQSKPAEAIVAFEQAMRIQGATGVLHHALGAAKAFMGRLLESEAHYQEALRLDPRSAEYYFHYSRLRTFTRQDRLHERIGELIGELTAQGDSSKRQRCHLHFAAGKIYDDLGEFDKAFDHFRLGNRCKQASYDREQWDRFVEETIDVFSAGQLKKLTAQVMHSAAGPPGPRIVFIVGMPRSGTSLVEQILASHPEVFGAGELPDLNLISAKVAELAGPQSSYPAACRSVGHEALSALGDQYRRRVELLAGGSVSVCCDKTPNNCFFIGLMHGLFSNVRVIHCRRDPLDTALSCYSTNFKDGQDFSYSLDDISHHFQLCRRIMRHWESVVAIPMLQMDYEHLVQEQEQATRQMLRFLGLPWKDDCLTFEHTQRVVATASVWQVRQPIYRSSVGRWRNYAKHLEPLRAQLLGQPSERSVRYRFDGAEQMSVPTDARVRASADSKASSDSD